ncbi:hypothetical protein PV461_36075, partial [Streptomyces scabiei]|nr:hypothetical protein [Streptomyces scabiei]
WADEQAAAAVGPAPVPALGEGELRGVRTRFGAELDLSWGPRGARAVLRPRRSHRIEVRTSSGDVHSLDLVAGEDHVLAPGTW